MCWCAGGYTCSVSADFRVDLGALTLVGPTLLTQARTCVSGRECLVSGLQAYHRMGEEPSARRPTEYWPVAIAISSCMPIRHPRS